MLLYHVLREQARRAELGAELAALRSRREQLSSVVASTPKPAASQKVLKRLQQASEQLQLLQSLQVRASGVSVHLKLSHHCITSFWRLQLWM